MDQNGYNYLLDRLPHSGSMRLIDTVLMIEGHTAETETMINENRVKHFGCEGRIETYIGVEMIAQTAAISLIFESDEWTDRGGVIMQVKSFCSKSTPVAGFPVLKTRSRLELLMGGRIALIKGGVTCAGNPFCEAILMLGMPGEGT